MNSAPPIILESLRPEHAERMFAGLADPASYLFLPDDPPPNVGALRARYERLAAGHSPGGAEVWLNWVVRRPASPALLGYTQATIRAGTATIAYHIFPAHWRQGVGAAAVRAMLAELFARPRMDGARALIDTRNAASIALVRKLGFERLRTIENADVFKGSRSDEHEFALSRADWNRLRYTAGPAKKERLRWHESR